ncbi:MAG: hypothetical protein SFV81_30460 [Pirellulaceae bacterium]|nr:hypothetical protein [Pirellulaceae bacterium]
MLDRREFAKSMAAGSLGLAGLASWSALGPVAHAAEPRKKIAFLGTDVFKHSHSQHFLDRFAMGYAMGGKWHAPRLDLASVYIDQFNEHDIGKQRLERYGLKPSSSVEDALTLGGSKLAVDGVIIIGEHGQYPKNELGQTLYPRYEWFKKIVKVFEASGRSVPVFNDKHLSTDWKQCAEMVADAKRLKFPFYAGSSLPVTWRLPAYEMPLNTPLKESVCVAYGGIDSYDFHAYETAQCVSERRQGGEVGIRSVHGARGEKLWAILDAPERATTRELFVSALSRSHNLPVDNGYPTAPVSYEWAKKALPDTIGFLVEHRDGFRTAAFLTAIRDFNYAGKRADTGEIIGCQMYLPMPGSSATTADFFTPLIRHVEDMILSGSTIYPIERTLLTSGMVIAGVQSLAAEKIVETPEMAVSYRAPESSTFFRV